MTGNDDFSMISNDTICKLSGLRRKKMEQMNKGREERIWNVFFVLCACHWHSFTYIIFLIDQMGTFYDISCLDKWFSNDFFVNVVKYSIPIVHSYLSFVIEYHPTDFPFSIAKLFRLFDLHFILFFSPPPKRLTDYFQLLRRTYNNNNWSSHKNRVQNAEQFLRR